MNLLELLENSPLPDGAEALLEPGRLLPEEEERILALALEKAGAGRAPGKGDEKPMKKSRFGLIVLAAALCLGTVAASAAAYFRMDSKLAQALGVEGEPPWDAAKNGGVIQTSQECDGWTMTVNQAVGDRNCAHILVDVEAPQGTVLDGDLYQIDVLLAFEGCKGGSYGWGQVEDEDKTDNRVSFLIDTTMDTDLRDTTGYLRATGLKEVTFGTAEGGADDVVEQLAELRWAINFPMRYEDEPLVYKPKRTISVERGHIKGSVTVERVEITPLSVMVRISGKEELLNRVEGRTAGTPGTGAVLVEVRDKAGDVLLPYSTGGKTEWNTIDLVLAFQPVVNPEDIVAVVVDGTEIPLE